MPPRQGGAIGRGNHADQKPRVAVGEGRNTRASGGQEHSRITLFSNNVCSLDVRYRDDGGTGIPRRASQYQVREPELTAHLRGVRGDGYREGVGGVDDGIDALLSQPTAQPLDTAEPADAHRTDRQGRVGYPAGQRADDLNVWVQLFRQRTALGGAAEQQHPGHCAYRPCRATEYR
ncbi:Uncharacterised protein [Mycobacterium tuberculosis]|uniref:Uncharacterized protein n=1 Tax=Mycobacterium tuberculosis TaxID=1773 RepID=A0A655JDX8_MYCTX|nr:Uncharacterised protein [Mycobacterium tuberculosis]COW77228.1 Uncharacterised protein [Mycobacterium tuberculosis]